MGQGSFAALQYHVGLGGIIAPRESNERPIARQRSAPQAELAVALPPLDNFPMLLPRSNWIFVPASELHIVHLRREQSALGFNLRAGAILRTAIFEPGDF
jgi:hypothetical protein